MSQEDKASIEESAGETGISRRKFLQATAGAAGARLAAGQQAHAAQSKNRHQQASHTRPPNDGIEPDVQDSLNAMNDSFTEPPPRCRPHTRWWWMGNALTKKDITWQLEQMRDQGIGGVEQITMEPVYKRGNHPYLSPAYFELITHAIHEAKRLDMEVSLNFGGPGWIWGGDWLPKRYWCQNLLASATELDGGQTFEGNLPTDAVLNPHDIPRSRPKILPADRVMAVVAGRVTGDKIERSSLVDLTAQTKGRRLTWKVPGGRWRLMAFWLVDCKKSGVLDPLSREAMSYYCDYLGGKFRAHFGDEFGKTVESFFGDSFEVPNYRNGIYWNNQMLGEFKKRKGYDLTTYLPALWFEVDDISPKIRYDVNDFLAATGMQAFFATFLGWCHRNGVRGRIQPYGFVTDILKGAGVTDIPEMEVTPGEKDAAPWFDTRIGPKAYVSSGAHLYGRNVVSVEAYTFQHWQPGRSTLEQLKISSDMFLRWGANKFYNSGFTGTPEHEFVPSRRFDAEITVSPVNVWWPYYHLLGDYVARCSALLRYGRPVADIAVYSPLANQWTLDVMNVRHWGRDFDWGDLARLILSNGYDFDLVNDDVLQNHARLANGVIRVRDLAYRILIVPNIQALPLESLKRIRQFARDGGTVIALERIPGASTGLADYRAQDAEVRSIARDMFREPAGQDGTGAHPYGRGRTYLIKNVLNRTNVLSRRASVFDPFVNTLRRHVRPDFGINFVRQDIRRNNGLTYKHRKLADADVYFVSNVQNEPVDMRVAFRVSGKVPQRWNPYNGEMKALYEYDPKPDHTVLPVRLAPYESAIFVFAAGKSKHVVDSTFAEILDFDSQGLTALAAQNGTHMAAPGGIGRPGVRRVQVNSVPGPFEIDGEWRLRLEGKDFPQVNATLSRLVSWTDYAGTRHFSGTGRYQITFDLPAAYTAADLQLLLSMGAVGDVADVRLNGNRAGVIWMRGQTLDVTSSVRSGKNEMTVLVTNTLINRVAGWKSVPPLPPHLKALYGGSIEDNTPQGRRLFGFKPLPRSGLLGPVLITPLKRVRLGLK